MKSLEELKLLYQNELQVQLVNMEAIRKRIKKYWIWGAIVTLVFIVLSLLLAAEVPGYAVFIPGFIVGVFLVGKGSFKYVSYRKEYKNQVVRKIVQLINPSFNYFPEKHIDIHDFNSCGIFSRKADRCTGDDFVQGKMDLTDFQFSEIKASYKEEEYKDGKREIKWYTLFSGIFFHADFNKHLQETTYVLPDVAEKLFGKFGQKFQKSFQRGQLVKLENPEFEKEFVVYGSSQLEARYILSPVMMEAIVKIKKKFARKFYFAFKGSRMYCAVSYSKALFEPRVIKSGVNFNDVEEMYHLFSLIEIIIKEMNLNTRIWTKE